MIQCILTPAAGKRLIAKALCIHPAIQEALRSGTIVVVAGTTNGAVAEELLLTIGQRDGFEKRRFFRGVTLPPTIPMTEDGRILDEADFPGDVVIVRGQWEKGKTLFDVVDTLHAGDVIIKGANALDGIRRKAAVLIGHPHGGTVVKALGALLGRRVRLIVPIGLEKCIPGDLESIADRINDPTGSGLRLFPIPGEIITEIEAIRLLSGAEAFAFAAGGVGGAEGAVRLAIFGDANQESSAKSVLATVVAEPPFAWVDPKRIISHER